MHLLMYCSPRSCAAGTILPILEMKKLAQREILMSHSQPPDDLTLHLAPAGFLVKPQGRGRGRPIRQNSRLLVQGASISTALPRNSGEKAPGSGRQVSGNQARGRRNSHSASGTHLPPTHHLRTCFPASSPRGRSVPVLSRPKPEASTGLHPATWTRSPPRFPT